MEHNDSHKAYSKLSYSKDKKENHKPNRVSLVRKERK